MPHSNISYRKDDRTLYLSYDKVLDNVSMPHHHFHIGYEIYYLLSGERYYFIQDRTYHITKGTLVIINSHELHRTASTDTPGYERIVINFNERFLSVENEQTNKVLRQFYDRINNNHCFVINLSENQQLQIEQTLSHMIDEISVRNHGFEAFIQAYLMQLVLTVNRYLDNLCPEQFRHLSLKHESVSGIIGYISKHFQQHIKITDISEIFFISPYYFSRIFKEATGFTFVEYLNSLRVKESQKLLLNTNMKINAICKKVGFGSVSQYNRVFKKITVISPREYRKKQY
ncbi:MAG TPA: AraC family transcriptional regulator [Clostridia bacterium]